MIQVQFMQAGIGVLAIAGGIIYPAIGFAQVTADDTLGGDRSITRRTGANAIEIEGGALRGANLFHSFREFNVEENGSVYFSNPSGIENILSRVTGNDASDILGTLGVRGDANLFLINPNGIIFGPNARLDLGGSFIATTANQIQFGNQGFFSATTPEAPPLLTIDPSALWFNQAQPGAILNRSTAATGSHSTGFELQGLRVPDGESLLLIGGNVSLTGGSLNAIGGRLELGGLSAPGVIKLTANGSDWSMSVPVGVARSNISFQNGAVARVAGEGGGAIAIYTQNLDMLQASSIIAGIEGIGVSNAQAGNVFVDALGTATIDNSTIRNIVTGDSTGNAGNVIINADRLIILNNGEIFASTEGTGLAGSIQIQTGTMDVNNSVLDSSSSGGGSAGGVLINAQRLVVFNNSTVNSNIGFGEGNAGNITIAAGAISLTDTEVEADTSASSNGQPGANNFSNGGTIFLRSQGTTNLIRSSVSSQVNFGNGSGRAGDIQVEAGSLSLVDDSELSSVTNTGGSSGNIFIQADGIVSLTNSVIGSGNSNSEPGGSGLAGNTVIRAGSLYLLEGSEIDSSTVGGRDGVRLTAGNTTIDLEDALFLSNSRIFSQTTGLANSGQITIDAGSISLVDASEISASTSDQGNAGAIDITANDFVYLEDSSSINSIVGNDAVGNGGVINIEARSLTLREGGQISASVLGSEDEDTTGGQGQGGALRINISELISLSGSSPNRDIERDESDANLPLPGASSGLYTSTNRGAIGEGGSITINAGTFRITDGAIVTAQTFNASQGGNLVINANVFEATSGGQILATTSDVGSAGSITLNATERILLSGRDPNFSQRLTEYGSTVLNANALSGLFASTAAGSDGQGGNIRISAPQLDLRGKATIATNSQGSGNSGNIRIAAGAIDLRNSARVTAETASSQGGNIRFQQVDRLRLNNHSQISTSTQDGQGGNLTINRNQSPANALQLQRSQILTQATRSGDSGRLLINSESLFAQDQSRIAASSVDGTGGSIRLQGLNQLQLDDSRIEASTNTGQAGSLSANARDRVQISDNSLLSVEATRGGIAGNLTVTTTTLNLTGGEIRVSSPTGQAGNLEVNAAAVSLDRGRLNAEAGISVVEDGSSITFNDLEMLMLQNNSQISASANASANGGNITINADNGFVVAPAQTNNDIIANASQGNGGAIQITTQGIFGIQPRPAIANFTNNNFTNDIDASSQAGISGTITINRPDTDPSRGVIELPADLVDASQQIDRSCSPGGSDQALSEFVVTGRGGLPPNPNELLDSAESLTGWVTPEADPPVTGSSPQPLPTSTQNPVIEAQSWIVDEKGNVMLVAATPITPASSWQAPLSCQ